MLDTIYTIRSLDVNTEWIISLNSRLSHAALINRSRRKRVTGRKRHAKTDKVSSSANVGQRTVPRRYTSDASIISIVFRPSDENKREGIFYARSRSTISSFFGQTAVDRSVDRIDSHQSGLDTLAFPSGPTIPAEQVHVPARRECIFVREPGEKALSPPLSMSTLSNHSCFIRIRLSTSIVDWCRLCEY